MEKTPMELIQQCKRDMKSLKEGIVASVLEANEQGALRLGKEYLEAEIFMLSTQTDIVKARINAIENRQAAIYKASL